MDLPRCPAYHHRMTDRASPEMVETEHAAEPVWVDGVPQIPSHVFREMAEASSEEWAEVLGRLAQ